MKTNEVEIPKVNSELDQDEEFFILKNDNNRHIQFHDYKSIYKVPGLYEEVFHNHLKCRSPQVISKLLYESVKKSDSDFEDLKILDFGAGNGLVAKELSTYDPRLIVGVDILDEAKEAALRDRKGVYTDYFVCNFSELSEERLIEFQSFGFNAFVSVAALGFGHIKTQGFIRAFNLIEKGGWIAINLRDRFLTSEDETGFGDMMNFLKDRYIKVLDEKTYQHRLSVSGKPIYYTAIVGRKLAHMSDS